MLVFQKKSFKGSDIDEENSSVFLGWKTIMIHQSWIDIFSMSTAGSLAGGFNPFEKYQSKWESSTSRDENNKYLKPPPSFPCQQQVPHWTFCTLLDFGPLKTKIPTKQLLLWSSWLGEIMFGSLSQNDPIFLAHRNWEWFHGTEILCVSEVMKSHPYHYLRLWRLMAIDPNDYLRLWPLMLRVQQHHPTPFPPKKNKNNTHKSGCQQKHPNLHPFHHQSLPRYMTHR